MRFMRANDRRADGPGSAGPTDVSPAVGTWFNCDPATGEIARLVLEPRDGGLSLRAFGASDPRPIDWGPTPAVPHAAGLGSTEVTGFTAHYDFDFMKTSIAANLKYGVLVIQSYNCFQDGSGRRPYITREFFHQDLGAAPPGAPVGDAAMPCRMAADVPSEPRDRSGGDADLSAWLGRWRNTYRLSRNIRAVILSRSGPGFVVEASGVGCEEPWGAVPAIPHATGVTGKEPAGFLARYDFGFSELVLSANVAKGLLIIASFASFRDGSGRSSYFNREFFYHEPIEDTPP